MEHWSLYQEFPIPGFEKTADALSYAVSQTTFDRFAGREAREHLATRGVYRSEIHPDSLLVLCKRTNDHFQLSLFTKARNPDAAEKFANLVRVRL
jgi:hypothetical protein